MIKKEALEKVTTARDAVTEAEESLQRLVGELERSPRAEKTTITEIVRDAFSRLDKAKSDLANLQRLLDKEDD